MRFAKATPPEHRDMHEYLDTNGFIIIRNAVPDEQLFGLLSAMEEIRAERNLLKAPGIRHLLRDCGAVRNFANSESIVKFAKAILGDNALPVRAILFDKTATSNWYVTWHQDVTIAVKERAALPNYGPWSIKHDVVHVQPPAVILENMVSLRVHLDLCSSENGAIKFIPQSHLNGILDAQSITDRCMGESVTCPAEPGDIILMRPLVLHSSPEAERPERRRVLHIEFADGPLPSGLQWAEV